MSQYAHPEVLINTQWLMEHLKSTVRNVGDIFRALCILSTLSPFKSAEELHTLYSSRGITADKEVFPYCAIGGQSAYTWFVLKYLLGYPKVRNYDGSWNEWSRLPHALIEQ